VAVVLALSTPLPVTPDTALVTNGLPCVPAKPAGEVVPPVVFPPLAVAPPLVLRAPPGVVAPPPVVAPPAPWAPPVVGSLRESVTVPVVPAAAPEVVPVFVALPKVMAPVAGGRHVVLVPPVVPVAAEVPNVGLAVTIPGTELPVVPPYMEGPVLPGLGRPYVLDGGVTGV
jgi:hypothetical protein